MTRRLYSWNLGTCSNRPQIMFLFPAQTLHFCGPVFSCLLPRKVTSLRRDKNQWHRVSSGTQPLQEAGALVDWKWAVFCCVDLGFPLKQPSGPNTWGRFHGFSNDLGHLWAPSSFPSCSSVVEPASSRPAWAWQDLQCFCALVHVKTREPFLERGPGLTTASSREDFQG